MTIFCWMYRETISSVSRFMLADLVYRFNFSGNNLFQMRFWNALNKTTYNHKNYDRICHKQQTQNFTKNYWVFVLQPLFQPGQMHLWGRSSLPSCTLCDSSTFCQRTACSGSQATILSTFFPCRFQCETHSKHTFSFFHPERWDPME